MPFLPDPRPAQGLRQYSMIPAKAAIITPVVPVLS
jgi:hypothetical protein